MPVSRSTDEGENMLGFEGGSPRPDGEDVDGDSLLLVLHLYVGDGTENARSGT